MAGGESKMFQLWTGQEKYVWPALDLRRPRLLAGLVLSVVGACLAGAGGVGGAGLFLPLLHRLVGFDAKTAAVMSSVMSVGGSVSNVLLTLVQGQKHPDPDRDGESLIDFEAALLLQPYMLLGISLGVIANTMLATWIIFTLLAATLGYTTQRSLRDAMRRWAKESLLKRGAGLNMSESVQSSSTRKDSDLEAGDLYTPLLVPSGGDQEGDDRDRTPGLPWIPVTGDRPNSKLRSAKTSAMLVLVWLVFFGIQALRGRSSGQCGPGYWLSTASLLPVSWGFTSWIARNTNAGRHAQDSTDSSDAVPVGDQVRHGGILVTGMSFLGGLLGSMLGVGGGMIVMPLFLEMRMPPQVTGATWCFMSLLSCSLSVVQYWMLGRIPVGHALLFGATSLVASSVRQLALERVVSRCGRPSIIPFTVSAALGLNALTMGGSGAYDVVHQSLGGAYIGFHPPRCIVVVSSPP